MLEISNAYGSETFVEEENSFITSFSRIFADSPTVLSLSKVMIHKLLFSHGNLQA